MSVIAQAAVLALCGLAGDAANDQAPDSQTRNFQITPAYATEMAMGSLRQGLTDRLGARMGEGTRTLDLDAADVEGTHIYTSDRILVGIITATTVTSDGRAAVVIDLGGHFAEDDRRVTLVGQILVNSDGTSMIPMSAAELAARLGG